MLARMIVASLLFAASIAHASEPAASADRNWPQFRGPQARGLGAGKETPASWNVEKGENVAWKTAIPGLGHSAAVVWGDRVFLNTCVGKRGEAELKVGLYGDIAPVDEDFDHEWRVLCLDRTSGKILWDALAHAGVPVIKRHTKATHANSTPATDGKHVVSFFGSEGLHCFDAEGKRLWKKDFGRLDSGFFMVKAAQWGFASSPIIHEDMVIILADVQEDSFVAALRLSDGSEIWRTPRTDVPTWGTPTVHVEKGRAQVLVNGFHECAGYDLKTGKKLWTLDGGGDIPVPTPFVAHDLIFMASAHGPAAPVFAIRTGATGDLELPDEGQTGGQGRDIAWWKDKVGVYMQTPIVVGDLLYACRDNGLLTVFRAVSGEKLYTQRLGGGSTGFTASPVACGDRVYFTSEVGDVHVVKTGEKYESLAVNSLGEVCMATPSISDGLILFRTQKHLIAVGKK